MRHGAAGSSILMVFLLVTALSVAALACVRATSFLSMLAFERQEAEYQYWAIYGLMNYANGITQTQKDVGDTPKYVGNWPTSQSPYQGVIHAVYLGDEVMITVQLVKNQKELRVLKHKKRFHADFLP